MPRRGPAFVQIFNLSVAMRLFERPGPQQPRVLPFPQVTKKAQNFEKLAGTQRLHKVHQGRAMRCYAVTHPRAACRMHVVVPGVVLCQSWALGRSKASHHFYKEAMRWPQQCLSCLISAESSLQQTQDWALDAARTRSRARLVVTGRPHLERGGSPSQLKNQRSIAHAAAAAPCCS